jgi:hypothetical protein
MVASSRTLPGIIPGSARCFSTWFLRRGQTGSGSASIGLLERIARETDSARIRLVLSVTERADAGNAPDAMPTVAALERLSQHRSTRVIELARLTPDEVDAVLTRQLGAKPEAALVRYVHQLSGGVLGAVISTLRGLRDLDSITVVDSHACLTDDERVPMLSDEDRFMTALRGLGEACRTVAGALSLLQPLGPLVPELIARSTGLAPNVIQASLSRLVWSGIATMTTTPGNEKTWAFRIPLVARTAEALLGPYERRRISAAAVETLWASDTPCRPPDASLAESYLPDRIADAVPLVDRKRALADLLAATHHPQRTPRSHRRIRWVRTAVALTDQQWRFVPPFPAVNRPSGRGGVSSTGPWNHAFNRSTQERIRNLRITHRYSVTISASVTSRVTPT